MEPQQPFSPQSPQPNDPGANPPQQPAMPPDAMPTDVPAASGQTPADGAAENPDKSFVITFLLAFFIGSLGVDRMYLGKFGTGIAKLVTAGGLGIWALVDLVFITMGKLRAKGDNRPLGGYADNKTWARIVAIVVIVLGVLAVVGLILLMVLFSVPSLQNNAEDVARKNEVNMVAADLAKYSEKNFTYPTATQFIDGTYKSEANLQKLKMSEITYKPSPEDCDAVKVACTSGTLIIKDVKGIDYVVRL